MSRLTISGPTATARQRAAILRGNLELIPDGPMRGRLSARLAELEAEADLEESFPGSTPVLALGDDVAERLCRHYDLGWQEGWDDAIAFVKGELIKPPNERAIELPECRGPQHPHPRVRPAAQVRPWRVRRGQP